MDPGPPDPDWDEALQAYLRVLSHGSDGVKIRATLELARLAPRAPPHILTALPPLLARLLVSSPSAPLRRAVSLALRRFPPSSSPVPSLLPLLSSLSPSLTRCLRSLASHDPANLSLLHRLRGLAAVLAILPESSAAPRRHLLDLLSLLASLRDSRAALTSSPAALRLLVEAVSGASVPYRARAVRAVGLLAASPRVKRLLVECGAVDALVRMMREGDAPSRAAAGNALGIVASHPDHFHAVVMAGAVPLYADLLQGEDSLGREVAEDALCVLAADGENMGEICANLAQILRGGTDTGRAAAADVFWDLASYTGGAGAIRQCGGTALLLEALREGTSLELRERASGAVAQLTYDADTRAAIVVLGGLPTLISMLECGEDELRENAAEMLVNFSTDPLYREDVAAIVESAAFRSVRDRLARSDEYLERLRLVSVDLFPSDLDLQ